MTVRETESEADDEGQLHIQGISPVDRVDEEIQAQSHPVLRTKVAQELLIRHRLATRNYEQRHDKRALLRGHYGTTSKPRIAALKISNPGPRPRPMFTMPRSPLK